MRVVRKLLVGLCVIGLLGCGSGADEATDRAAAIAENEPRSSTATAAPTTVAASEEATLLTAEDLNGIWVSDEVDSQIPPFIVQLNDDGTYAVALSEDRLATAPEESGEWTLDGAKMTLNAKVSGCPGVLERPGLYEVELSDAATGAVLWSVVDDPCELRMSFLEQGPLSPK